MPEKDAQGITRQTVYQQPSNNVYGQYEVQDRKMHITQTDQTQVYELLDFNRDRIEVCQYFYGQSCLQGQQMTILLNNNAGSLREE